MQLEFPYQVVTFLGKEPELNEPVYYGVNGWYPQLALKRRFKINQLDEDSLIKLLKEFFDKRNRIDIITGELVKPERMPVQVIDITNQSILKDFHSALNDSLGDKVVSRYPDREVINYYAHITAEYNNQFVIPVDKYINKEFSLDNVWLLKDVSDENSLAYIKIM